MHESSPFQSTSPRLRAHGPAAKGAMRGESDQQNGGSAETGGRQDRPADHGPDRERGSGTRGGHGGMQRGHGIKPPSDTRGRREDDVGQERGIDAGTPASIFCRPPAPGLTAGSTGAGRSILAAVRDHRLHRRVVGSVLAENHHWGDERKHRQVEHRRDGAQIRAQSAIWLTGVEHRGIISTSLRRGQSRVNHRSFSGDHLPLWNPSDHVSKTGRADRRATAAASHYPLETRGRVWRLQFAPNPEPTSRSSPRREMGRSIGLHALNVGVMTGVFLKTILAIVTAC
jgi:hypothetical protein